MSGAGVVVMWARIAVAGGFLVAWSALAVAQTSPAWPQPVRAQPAATAPGAGSVGVVQSAQDGTPLLVDGPVTDVRVEESWTLVTMNGSPQSPCPSTQYVYERERPKWIAATGRLQVAMREGARVRVSFNCRNGYQRINAIQFLSPPPVVAVTRRR
ncbi:MAG: hypothetical protein AcusKO_25540 [Acuticoccus sp.]